MRFLALTLALLSVGCSTTLRVPGQQVGRLRALERRPVARLSDGDQWVEVDADSPVVLELADGRRFAGTAGAVRVRGELVVLDGPRPRVVRANSVRRIVVHGRERSGITGGQQAAILIGGMLLVAVAAGMAELRLEL